MTILGPAAAVLLFVVGSILAGGAGAETPDSNPLSEASILHDSAIPVMGNPEGDVTVVEYFDYQCPYCRKVSPELAKIVREDGNIRLVQKNWPIFGKPSVLAAKLALAAQYQGKYPEAHEALISMKEKLSEDNVQSTLSAAGVDVERAKKDLATNQTAVDAALARNHEQALALGFQGTPAFIIGRFRVPGVLDAANFKRAIADARAAAKNP
jgi:protein-disulfide isomerase